MLAPLVAIGARALATEAGGAIAARGAQAVANRVLGTESAGGLTSLIGRSVHLSNLVQAKGPAMISAIADLGQFLSAIRPAPASTPAPDLEKASAPVNAPKFAPMPMRMG